MRAVQAEEDGAGEAEVRAVETQTRIRAEIIRMARVTPGPTARGHSAEAEAGTTATSGPAAMVSTARANLAPMERINSGTAPTVVRAPMARVPLRQMVEASITGSIATGATRKTVVTALPAKDFLRSRDP